MFVWGVVTGAAIMFGGVLLGAVLAIAIRDQKPAENTGLRFSSKEGSK